MIRDVYLLFVQCIFLQNRCICWFWQAPQVYHWRSDCSIDTQKSLHTCTSCIPIAASSVSVELRSRYRSCIPTQLLRVREQLQEAQRWTRLVKMPHFTAPKCKGIHFKLALTLHKISIYVTCVVEQEMDTWKSNYTSKTLRKVAQILCFKFCILSDMLTTHMRIYVLIYSTLRLCFSTLRIQIIVKCWDFFPSVLGCQLKIRTKKDKLGLANVEMPQCHDTYLTPSLKG